MRPIRWILPAILAPALVAVAIKAIPVAKPYVLPFLLRIPHRVSVTGRVTDSDGKPIKGVAVSAVPLPIEVHYSEDAVEPKDKREFRTVTRDDGRYRLSALLSVIGGPFDASYEQSYAITADAEGYAPQRMRLGTTRGPFSGHDFILEKAATVSGRAIDTRGRPLAKRPLQLSLTDRNADASRARQKIVPKSQDTDESGRFRFERVPAGDYLLAIAVYPDHGLAFPQSTLEGVLKVSAGETLADKVFIFESPEDRGAVAGRVLDALSGQRIETFTVRVARVELPNESGPVHGFVRTNERMDPFAPYSGVAGQNGGFRIEGISPGTATLEISSPGYATAKAAAKVRTTETVETTILLVRETGLTGTP